MRQEAFEKQRDPHWRSFEVALARLERGEPSGIDFPRAYRRVCHDLALARDRGFGAGLQDRLNVLILRGHRLLYAARAERSGLARFLVAGFPRAVRREWRLVLLVSLLFYGAALACFAFGRGDPSFVHYVLAPEQIRSFESMYDPTQRGDDELLRDAAGDVAAFAFYVANNVEVAFRTFAWGIFAGVGSLFVVVYNGVLLGAVAAHLTNLGLAHTFFPFVIGHGAFELTAILLAGAAGVRLGWALLAPGRLRRGVALRRAGARAVPLLYGMTLMLVVAAVFEAFWSGSDWIPAALRLGVGAGLWLVVGLWLVGAGRRRAG